MDLHVHAGEVVASSVPADARWHQLLVSHYTARGESLFFVDGVLAGRAAERLAPAGFTVGGPALARRLDVKDVLIYRSALNADEAASAVPRHAAAGKPRDLRAVERCAFRQGTAVENRAQSLAALTLEAGSAIRVAR